MGVGLVVERVDVDVSGRAVEAGGFPQGLVGLEPYEANSSAAGMPFKLMEDASPDAEAPSRGSDPHALDLGRFSTVELQGPAADGLVSESSDQQKAGRFDELFGVGGDASARIEPAVEARLEFAEVRLDAEPGSGAAGVLDLDVYETRGQQLPDDRWVTIRSLISLTLVREEKERGQALSGSSRCAGQRNDRL